MKDIDKDGKDDDEELKALTDVDAEVEQLHRRFTTGGMSYAEWGAALKELGRDPEKERRQVEPKEVQYPPGEVPPGKQIAESRPGETYKDPGANDKSKKK